MKKRIVYAPKGLHTITPHINGVAKRVTVDVTASAVSKLNSSLSELKQSSIEPCGYFDHTQGKRSFLVDSFAWDEHKGIMANVELSKAGQEAIEGKDYGYFSPRFALQRGEIVGLIPNSAEVGSLVNEPAFRAIPSILAASQGESVQESDEVLYISASLAHADFIEDETESDDNNQKGDNVPLQPQKRMKEQLIKLLGLAEDIDDDALWATLKQRLDKKDDDKDKLMADLDDAKKEMEEVKASHATTQSSLEATQTENAELKKKLAEQGDAAADAFVEAACSAGKIPPRDGTARASLKQLYLDNPAHATSVMSVVTASQATQLQPPVATDGKDALVAHIANQLPQ